MAKFEVGDKVKLIDSGFSFAVGTVGEIVSIIQDSVLPYKVRFDGKDQILGMKDGEIELVSSPYFIYEASIGELKIGDRFKAVAIKNGDVLHGKVKRFGGSVPYVFAELDYRDDGGFYFYPKYWRFFVNADTAERIEASKAAEVASVAHAELTAQIESAQAKIAEAQKELDEARAKVAKFDE